MPIAFDTDETREFRLATDAAKPAPPAFVVRFLTRKQALRYDELVAHALATRDNLAEFWSLCWQAINIGVVGWRNMPLAAAGLPADAPFNRENAEAMLTVSEIMELAFGYTAAVSVTGDDQKNSSTQPSSDVVAADPTAGNAESEPTAAGLATTPQT